LQTNCTRLNNAKYGVIFNGVGGQQICGSKGIVRAGGEVWFFKEVYFKSNSTDKLNKLSL